MKKHRILFYALLISGIMSQRPIYATGWSTGTKIASASILLGLCAIFSGIEKANATKDEGTYFLPLQKSLLA